MDQSTRTILFIVWLVVVTLACFDSAYSSPPMFGSIVLPIAWLPFWSKQQYAQKLPKREMFIGLIIVAMFLVLVIYGALSGFNRASNEWYEHHSGVRVYFALGVWFVWLVLGFRAFRADRFLASGT